MIKKDIYKSLLAGGLVGFLIQPIIANVIPDASFLIRIFSFFLVLFGAPTGIFIFSLLGRAKPTFFQIGKFLVVGILNTTMDIGLLNVAIYLTDITQGWFFSTFKLVSFTIASVNSLFWNKMWTFESVTPITAKETIKFYAVTLIGAILNVGIVSILVNFVSPINGLSLKVWDNIAAAIATIITLFWNFTGYKLLVFKNQDTE